MQEVVVGTWPQIQLLYTEKQAVLRAERVEGIRSVKSKIAEYNGIENPS